MDVVMSAPVGMESLLEILQAMSKHRVVGFLDADQAVVGSSAMGCRCWGGESCGETETTEDQSAIVAIGITVCG